MKKLTLLIIFALVWGCGSKTEQPNYYQLSYPATVHSQTLSDDSYILVAPVKMNRFLNDNGVVYQLSDVEFTVARSNLWGAPLPRQIQESLAANLRQELPSCIILTERIYKPEITVGVYIDGFHGRYDGTGVVSGKWVIQKGENEIVARSFENKVIQEKDGYSSLIQALSKGWEQEAVYISQEIKNILR